MGDINKGAVLDWLRRLNTVYSNESANLNELDSAIGDADHGTNMARGFAKVTEKLEEIESKDVGTIFKDIGMILISTVGGSSGPLYGTFFLRAGATVGDVETLSAANIAEMFDAALAGIVQRGKAELNDKTMVDALSPAVDALKAAIDAGKELDDTLTLATEAAKKGMEDTIPMVARKGRASYLGERSAGHQDPGATSSYFLIRAAQEIWGREGST